MKIKKIKIFANSDAYSKKIKNELQIKLENNNFILADDDFDLGISIGGDGAFLRMLRETKFKTEIYYVGINTGSLGFVQDIIPNDIDLFIKKLLESDFDLYELPFEEIKIKTSKKTFEYKAVNEFALRDINLKSMRLEVFVDSQILEKFIGDGLLISTPFGSTAYNLSQGGSIIYPEIEALEITPLAPINNAFYKTLINPFIIPKDITLSFKPENVNRGLLVFRDGELVFQGELNSLTIKLSNSKIKCLVNKNYSYTERLKEKLLNTIKK